MSNSNVVKKRQYGPQIVPPPQSQNQKEENDNANSISTQNNNNENNSKPEPPIKKAAGPALPPHLLAKRNQSENNNSPSSSNSNTNQNTNSSNSNDDKNNSNNSKSSSIGPSLPPHLLSKSKETTETETQPKLQQPKNNVDDDDEDDGGFGPIPMSALTEDQIEMLSQRNKQIASDWEANEWKRVREGDDQGQSIVRDEWMTALPSGRTSSANIGAGGKKQFNKRDAVGPDLSWAVGPGEQKKRKREDDDKEYAQMLKQRAIDMHVNANQKQQPQQQSLVEIHKEMKRKESGNQQQARRPFDREQDLGTYQMDAVAKKKYIEKTTALSSNFMKGSN